MLETFVVVKKKFSLHPDVLKGLPFFASFSLERLQEIIESARVVSPKANQVILRQGEHLDVMYLILEGSVKVQGQDSDGVTYQFGEIGKGYFLGEFASLQNEASRATFTTIEDSDLLAFDRAIMLDIIRRADPEQVLNIFSVLEGQNNAASERGFR